MYVCMYGWIYVYMWEGERNCSFLVGFFEHFIVREDMFNFELMNCGEREKMRVDRRVNYNSVKYSVLLYLLRGRLSIDVYRPLQWRVRTLRSWTTGRFVACTRMVVTSFRGLLQFEWYSLLFLSWSFEVCRPSSSCPGGKFFVIPTGRHATRDTLNDGFWNRWNSLVSLSLFFFYLWKFTHERTKLA